MWFSNLKHSIPIEPNPGGYGLEFSCKVSHDKVHPMDIGRFFDVIESNWENCKVSERERFFSSSLREFFGEAPIENVIFSCLCCLGCSQSARKGLQMPGQHIHILAFCARWRNLVQRLMDLKFCLAPPPNFLAWLDDFIKVRFKHWATTIQLSMVPLPNAVETLETPIDFFKLYLDKNNSRPFMAIVPLTDVILYLGFG